MPNYYETLTGKETRDELILKLLVKNGNVRVNDIEHLQRVIDSFTKDGVTTFPRDYWAK